MWCQISDEDESSGWNLNAPIKAYDRIIVFGGNGLVGYFDNSINCEFEQSARKCVFTGPYLQGRGDNLSVGEVELLAESGQAGVEWDSDSFDPTVTLEYSRDEGRTWKSKGTRKTGRLGAYRTNAIWRRLGRFDDRAIFRFTSQHDSRQSFTGIKITYEEGY